ncbi:hypothetical protein K9B35_02905 [Sphingomonas sp. R647]|uniref:alpha/beta hydrolase family esterase n=1 Tax=Sphingomonas sp. R647 TaxID=2875233 RepID=UPI001CD677D7|nr:PHB depolymerase family esterase [Sphingomonas sp. R647]MCA1196905.1 hypothetical protein [Sphingomonas sp. R647]
MENAIMRRLNDTLTRLAALRGRLDAHAPASVDRLRDLTGFGSTYPERFAGGAIIAGLPYGTANSVPEAFDRMRAHGGPAPDRLTDLVTSASTHDGPWPRISVWHGDNDKTVSAANAALIVAQWRTLHGAVEAPGRIVSGHTRRVWHNADGREVIEAFEIVGLGHGTPLSTAGPDACGVPGPYMLEAGTSSTRHIADFWGLLDLTAATRSADAPPVSDAHRVESAQPVAARSHQSAPDRTEAFAAGSIGATIENALRAAGLMR